MSEYIDTKKLTHRIVQIVLPCQGDKKDLEERIVEDLFHVFVK